MSNKAREVLWPTDPNIIVRVVMLHVGQGSSTIVLGREGAGYRSLLLDINLDEKGEGIDVPALMDDLLNGVSLDVFANSHPHEDHLCGVTDLSDRLTIHSVWHSGHVPERKVQSSYDNLQKVIKKVTKDFGADAEVELLGSTSPFSFGDAEYYVLAPAEHVCDSIDDETDEVRRKRIHEQCAVLKFGIPDTWVMLPGDADRDAWEKNILPYHDHRAGAQVLAAIHHGSHSFFKKPDNDTDIYRTALETIDPEWVIVSAPKQANSKHKHPHDDAMELYEDQVGAERLCHTGEACYSYIIDIYDDGSYEVTDDGGELREAYPYTSESNGSDDSGNEKSRLAAPAIVIKSRHNIREAEPFA
ncbi:MAG: hypothetical protein QM758_13750 [Armatimonas sp.]